MNPHDSKKFTKIGLSTTKGGGFNPDFCFAPRIFYSFDYHMSVDCIGVLFLHPAVRGTKSDNVSFLEHFIMANRYL